MTYIYVIVQWQIIQTHSLFIDTKGLLMNANTVYDIFLALPETEGNVMVNEYNRKIDSKIPSYPKQRKSSLYILNKMRWIT
jgi:hypothetical protein